MVATWSVPGVFVRSLKLVEVWAVGPGRVAIAGLALLPVVLAVRPWREAFAKAVRSLEAWAAAGCMTGYYLSATAAFRLAPLAIAALLVASSPVLVAAAKFLRGTRPTAREVAGIAVALLGVAACVLPEFLGVGRSTVTRVPLSPAGTALSLLAACFSAAFVLVRSHLTSKGRAAPAPVSVLLTGLLGVPLFAVAAPFAAGLWGGGGSAEQIASAGGPTRMWILLLGLGVAATALPTLFYAMAAARLPALVTSVANLLVPVGAGTAALLILGERPSLWAAPGALAVLAGVFLVATAARPAPPQAAHD